MILAQARIPVRFQGAHFFQHGGAHRQFDGMTLAVIETDGLNPRIALQGPGQAGGGILATAKQDQGGIGYADICGISPGC